jgi:creatinine amidohydrolase
LANDTVFLDELTEPDVAALVADGLKLLLVPTGSTEQHGPHGPIGTDVIIPREVCRRVAETRGGLVAPAIPYGLAAGHKGFSGLAYLSVRTYLSVIEDLIHSFVESGFSEIVFVNGHYTNYPAINLACFNASAQLSAGSRAWALSYWDALPPEQADAYLSLRTGLHANIGETSAVMAVRPELVKLDRAVAGWPALPQLKGPAMPTVFAYFETSVGSTHRALPHGVWGDPRRSSAELGETYFEQIAEAVCAVIDDVRAADAQMPIVKNDTETSN